LNGNERNREAQLYWGCITMILMILSCSSSQEIPCHSWKCKAAYCVLKTPVNIIHKRFEQSEQKKQSVPSLLLLYRVNENVGQYFFCEGYIFLKSISSKYTHLLL
jgi:hypothetical protein